MGIKVISLIAENFKRLKAVTIKPDNSMVVISGANEQGKSSVIDAIWWAVGGSEMTKATGTTKAIRDGQEKASVTVDFGDIKVTRKETKSASTLTVENKDGSVYKSPQSLLDGLVGKVAFDPLSFSSMDDKKQLETLLKIVNISIDPIHIADRRKEIFDERTSVNRVLKSLEAQLEASQAIPEGTPDTELSLADIMVERDKAQEVIDANNDLRRVMVDHIEAIDDHKEKIAMIESQIAKLKENLDMCEKDLVEEKCHYNKVSERLKTLDVDCKRLIDPDISVFKEMISKVEETNHNVMAKAKLAEIYNNFKSTSSKADALTKEIEDLDSEKTKALSEATFPVDGLGFTDSCVTYKGIPFAQCSSAERLRVSVAMAMAMNPKMRVIRITDGSLIDSKNMSVIESMVKENDFQCWIEKVSEDKTVGIFIEDGEVKS
jgi:chromosome segregation ATPase